jgi:diketogulonate reductase-like aldo/keto reductase
VSGFRAIDTANQAKYYSETEVGAGIKRFLTPGEIQRKDIFIQSKFTYAHAQAGHAPYALDDPIAKQVRDSFNNTLANLATTYLDAYLLHAPFSPNILSDEDLTSWQAIALLKHNGQVRKIGVSNIIASQLVQLLGTSDTRPDIVQNFSLTQTAWDHEVRVICAANGIQYQGYGLLRAKIAGEPLPLFSHLAAQYHCTVAQVIYRFCQQLGVICITGASNVAHMKQALAIGDFSLSEAEIALMLASCR